MYERETFPRNPSQTELLNVDNLEEENVTLKLMYVDNDMFATMTFQSTNIVNMLLTNEDYNRKMGGTNCCVSTLSQKKKKKRILD